MVQWCSSDTAYDDSSGVVIVVVVALMLMEW